MSHAEREREELAAVADFIKELSNVVPSLVKGVLGTLFSEEAGANMGKAVGNFYKQLKEAGIPEATAVEMTRDYLSTLTKWSDILKGVKIGEFKGEGATWEVRKRVQEHAEKSPEETPTAGS